MLIDSSFPPDVRDFLDAWRLFPDGPLLTTRSSWVLPVQHEGSAAVLKVARAPGELLGYRLLTWWDGQGAAKVFASSPGALLMDWARSADGLAQMAWSGQKTKEIAGRYWEVARAPKTKTGKKAGRARVMRA